jgi:hypothetical protein
MKRTLFVILLCTAFSSLGGRVAAAEKPLVIQNAVLEAQYDASSGQFALIDRASGKPFVQKGELSAAGGTAAIAKLNDPVFGAGQALTIVHADGGRDSVELFTNLPFALFRATLHNDAREVKVVRSLKTWKASGDVGAPAAELTSLGTAGLLSPDKNPGSYMWLAVAEPSSRRGVVAGWLTSHRGSGIVFSSVDQGQLQLAAQIDYGQLRLEPGHDETLETLAVGYFADARLGLEAWADAVAKIHKVKLRPQPAGYCTWYSQPYGGAADEKHLAELAVFSAKNLAPFGFSVVQIDDRWQEGISHDGPKRNFTTHRVDGPYPHGMKAAADNIHSLGLTPGIWFLPFAGTSYDPFFKDHQDWFVKTKDGKPYEVKWGGTCLDMTNPGAREHLRSVAHRITHDWGFKYLKVDGLWTGTATKIMYVNSGYKDDGMGDAVFFDPNKTNVEAFRDGLKLLREAAGDDVFILGCNIPQNMRTFGAAFGLVDAMRVGPDNKADWKNMLRGPSFGTRQYFLNGRVWFNDPDPVYVREKVPLAQAQAICSWATLSGQLNLSSEWIPGLPPERLDILKRTLPAHGLLPRPVDIFDADLPRIWLLTDTRKPVRRDVVGVFNWDDRETTIEYPLDRLGLEPSARYVAFDFWKNALVAPVNGKLSVKVPGTSCAVLAVRPVSEHPQLISTSRHITQGIVDVLDESWNATANTLVGKSQLVGGDVYELRIAADNTGWIAEAVEISDADRAAGVKAELKQENGLVRATISSDQGREIAWSVRFKPATRSASFE